MEDTITPRIYLLLFIISIIFAIFLLSTISTAIQQKYNRQERPADNRDGTPDPNSSNISPNALVDAIDAYRQQRDSHEYDRAQREYDTIIVLSLTGFFALLAAGAGISAVIITHKDTQSVITESRGAAFQQHEDTLRALTKTDDTITALKIQAETMKGQLATMQAAQRPWITAVDTAIKTPLKVSSGGRVAIAVNSALINIGHAPARAVFTPAIGEYFWIGGGAPVCQHEEELNRHSLAIRNEMFGGGNTVFPNQRLPLPYDTYFTGVVRVYGPTVLHVRLLVCVVYKFIDSNELRSTGIEYDILHTVEDADPSVHFLTETEYPIDKLRLKIVHEEAN